MITSDQNEYSRIRKGGGLSQRSLARMTDGRVSQATISLVESGKAKPPAELLKVYESLSGKRMTAPAPLCRSCGEPHFADDCGGKKVVSVVVLADGERISRKRKAAPPTRLSDMTLAQLKWAIENRTPFLDHGATR